MDPQFLLIQATSGFTMAMILFLVASGLTLLFGVVNVFNFAHGSFYMIGAYLAYTCVSVLGFNFWASLVLAGLGAGVFGMLMESIFLRRIYGRAEEAGFQILLTYSFILIIDDLVKLVWGTEYKSISRPPGFSGAVELFGVLVPTYNLAIIALGLIVAVAAWLLLSRTRAGRIARATAIDREMLSTLGVNVPLTLTVVFGVATALGGLAGALAAPLRSVTPGAGIEVIIDSLIVVVLGGMGNFWGAFLGAIILGEVNAFAVAFVADWASLFSFIVMIVVLIFKPQGLFSPAKVRKA
ncbi:Amino acid/amide ABC transporter membrane protein 1, HAAT family [Syntrophobacter sp. SbD1]|nr:Amino acid/amide ABC transporter membrane protein 1, HAAT family [Syntrophobacter sp. SbD1]